MLSCIGCLLLGLAYVLLLGGVFGDLVNFKYNVTVDPHWFTGTEAEATFKTISPFIKGKPLPMIPETTRSLMGGNSEQLGLVQWLWQEAVAGRCSYYVSAALLVFGVGIPCLKLVLFAAWSARGPQWLMSLAKEISRWAAVDAVAEAMLVAFFLKAGVDAKHCFGFVAFISYCILSTIAFWFFEDLSSSRQSDCIPALAPNTYVGHCGRVPVVVTGVLFICLLGLGVSFPLGQLHIPPDSLQANANASIEPYRPGLAFIGIGDADVDKLVKTFVQNMPKPQSEVSVLSAVTTLLSSGHFFTCVGSALLFVGVLFLPALEAVILSVFAWRSAASPEEKPLSGLQQQEHDRLSHILNAISDLNLLDVFVVGMFFAVSLMSSVEIIQAELLHGYHFLVGAVLVGWLHQVVCRAAASPNHVSADISNCPNGA